MLDASFDGCWAVAGLANRGRHTPYIEHGLKGGAFNAAWRLCLTLKVAGDGFGLCLAIVAFLAEQAVLPCVFFEAPRELLCVMLTLYQ